MKKKSFILAGLAALSMVSCTKRSSMPETDIDVPLFDTDGEIVLVVDNGVPNTKVTAISSIPSSLYLERTTGTWKSESAKNNSASFSVSSGKINTGWYQTASPTAYNYYISNSPITFAAGGSTVAATNTTDVIAGCTQAATTSTTPSAALEHVFARTGTLSTTITGGYTLNSASYKIKSNSGAGTGGTYNIATKAWSGTTALSETALANNTDLYLVPGSYTLTGTFNYTRGEFTRTVTKTANITLEANKINNIKVTLAISGSDAATEIIVGVTLSPWASKDLNVSM